MPAYYRATLSAFVNENRSTVIGKLAEANADQGRFALPPEQIDAWRAQLPSITASLDPLLAAASDAGTWEVLLEYPIPRIGRRIDAVMLTKSAIIVVEFKTGESAGSAAGQVEDYALCLSSFHEASHGKLIIPVVVNENLVCSPPSISPAGETGISVTNRTSLSGLGEHLAKLARMLPQAVSIPSYSEWDQARFRPTPSIIEAAVALYGNQDIFEIGHACAAHESLEKTTRAIVVAAGSAQKNTEKAICFVTGVPGAGKTLVGLNAVHHSSLKGHSSFLSGNGPLVKVLQEALIRDRTRADRKDRVTRQAAQVEVRTFVQNVHRFAGEEYSRSGTCSEHVVVFDEAQRAWDKEQNEKKFERSISEPEMMLSIMDRHEWAVIVALVGGGQEINDGEAGIGEWGRALLHFPNWRIYASPEVVSGGASVAGFRLAEDPSLLSKRTTRDGNLHLDISMRSIRAKQINGWVNAVLDGRMAEAREIAKASSGLPLVTRRLTTAKAWLKTNRIGGTRAGLVASASATRLRADGLEPSYPFHKDYDWENWFLDGAEDMRSSNHLEVHATQFEIQGLELDWVGLCWSEDFVWDDDSWQMNSFRNKAHPKTGSHWVRRSKSNYPQKFSFLLNAYRVLLTRARRGTVIYVPSPGADDPTRSACDLDATAKFLISCGAKLLDREAATQIAV